MTNDVLRLAAELMAIDSTSGQEGELMAHVSLMLESRGWRVTRIPVTPGRMNVHATCVHERHHARDGSLPPFPFDGRGWGVGPRDH